ncbi:MAG: SulP family inorganic anion transporter [Pseudobdellovibrionaceae bacterium]
MLPTHFTPKIVTVLKEGYDFARFKGDIIAGLTVAIVALPLAMALAIASGTSPDKGLVTAVIAGFLISALGGSRVQIGGPTGAFVVVVYGIIAAHGFDGLVLATLMAGVILLVAGYARMGQLIKFIPYPVITGFTAGIAVIIASSQVKDFFGLTIDKVPADFIPKWESYVTHFGSLQWAALMIGGLALFIIIVLRRLAPKVPGYILAVIVCSGLAAAFHLPVETIGTRFPDLPAGLPIPHFPDWSLEKARELIPAAFTIAFLAGIEALLSAVVADGMTGYKHRPSQELIGQGFANIASSLFGGLPATGAIARTATNIKSGGQTPFAGIFHAVFLLLFMLFAMDLVAYIPMPVLAAILFVVAWGMSEMHHFIRIFKISASDRVILVLTFLLTVLVDLTVAIGVGVTLASLLFMRNMSRTVEIKSQKNDIKEDETQRLNLPQGVEVFQINGPLFFGVASELLETLKTMGQMPRILILRMRYVPYLDTSGEHILDDLIRQCRARGTDVIFSALQSQPHAVLKKAGHATENGIYFEDDFEAALSRAKMLQA